MAEYGIIFSKEIQNIIKKLPEIISEKNGELSGFGRALVVELYNNSIVLDKRIASCDKKITHLFNENEKCKRISKIPGIGVISATALVSAIGD